MRLVALQRAQGHRLCFLSNMPAPYAEHLLRPLGEAGAIIFLRLSAFILLCLGVQIVWDGLSELLRSLLP